jgi:hypothetical protein
MRIGKSTSHSGDGNVNSHGKKAGAANKGHGKAFKNGGTMKTRKGTGKNIGTNVGR